MGVHHSPTRAIAKFSAMFDLNVIDGIVNFFGFFSRISSVIIEFFDRVFVDGGMVIGTARLTSLFGVEISCVQTGYVRHYLLLTVLGIIAISIIAIFVV